MKKQVRQSLAQSMSRRRDVQKIAIREYPHLEEHIQAWPDLANSLLPTGRQNQLHVSNGAYLNTGITFDPQAAAGFRFCVVCQYDFTPYIWNMHGSISGNTACCIGFSPSRYLTVGNGSSIVELKYAPEFIGHMHTYDMRYSPDGKNISICVGSPADVENHDQLHVSVPVTLGGTRTSLSLFRCNGIGAVFSGTISEAVITSNGIEHRLVPYIQDGHCGLLDLTDLTFHGNASTSGILTIINSAT